MAFLATATAYAFFQVPYVAMPAEMTDDYTERTRLMTWRVAVLALAILISGGLAPVVVNAAGHGIPGYRAMGAFVGVLIVVGAVGAFAGTAAAPLGARAGIVLGFTVLPALVVGLALLPLRRYDLTPAGV